MRNRDNGYPSSSMASNNTRRYRSRDNSGNRRRLIDDFEEKKRRYRDSHDPRRGNKRDTRSAYIPHNDHFENKPGWRVLNKDPYFRTSHRKQSSNRGTHDPYARPTNSPYSVKKNSKSLFMSHKDLREKYNQFERHKHNKHRRNQPGLMPVTEEKWVSRLIRI